jgi:hypothetical protein
MGVAWHCFELGQIRTIAPGSGENAPGLFVVGLALLSSGSKKMEGKNAAGRKSN